MRLSFKNLTRTESSESVINNLKRKGWVEMPDDVKPEYNPETQQLSFNSADKTYSILDLPEREVNINKFQSHVSQGFLVEPENFTIGLDENDRAAFSQMLSLVKEALDLSLITNETPQTISDKSGQKHQLTTLRFRQVMVAYGFYFKGLWDELNS